MTGAEPGSPEQGALFEIEGPDEDSCVWLVSGEGEEAVVVNLGPRRAVADKLADWLASIGRCGQSKGAPRNKTGGRP